MHRNLFARNIRLPTLVSRSFSASSVLSQKSIDLTPFKKIKLLPDWASIKWNLKPTSKWHLPWVRPFCDLWFSSIGFNEDDLQNIELLPAERVFAECPARKDDIVNGDWKLDLEGVCERSLDSVEEKVNATFNQMRSVIRQYEFSNDRAEKTIDVFALLLTQLCGFGTDEFELKGLSIAFQFAGMKINSEADVYVAVRKESVGQLVLIWEDKLSKTNSGGNNTTANMLEASAAQIIGEMISVHYQNNENKFEPCEVYAIRLIDEMVAFFKMEMTAEQIEDVCQKGLIPDPKLQVC